MKVERVRKSIIFSNGEEFREGDKVTVKGYSKPEITAEIDSISEDYGEMTVLCFMADKGSFRIYAKDIESIKHVD